MTIWAIADLHLSISKPEKDMAFFGPAWKGYQEKIAANWKEVVQENDLVLIAGDICWAMRGVEAVKDLQWIDALPGKKVMIRGNHDYWWSSMKKVREACPPSIEPLHHTATNWKGVSISGTRLWDTEEFSFGGYIEFQENPRERKEKDLTEDRKIFERELIRLELALKALDQRAEQRILMTHYPPIGADLKPSRASKMIDQYNVDLVIFGHLHNLKPGLEMFGGKYLLTSADYLDFKPLKIG